MKTMKQMAPAAGMTNMNRIVFSMKTPPSESLLEAEAIDNVLAVGEDVTMITGEGEGSDVLGSGLLEGVAVASGRAHIIQKIKIFVQIFQIDYYTPRFCFFLLIILNPPIPEFFITRKMGFVGVSIGQQVEVF